ncbi:MAG: fumarylacetoacetate hydrolase family protein [Rhizobiaceae bacterium]|nr:fumarylacetoacetate hydrolase family protein [Rhizobiaceae bacterium]
MRTDYIHRVARERFNGWRDRQTFTQLVGEDAPQDMAEAYEVQSSLYGIMREEAGFTEFAGYKVALTSPAIQEMCGVNEPAFGAVFREFVHANGHEINPAEFIRLGIEFEIAFEIGQDLPEKPEGYTKETVANFISAAAPAFELIDDRDADYAHLDAKSILCDRCWCNGVVLGERVTAWHGLDVGNLATRIIWNGVEDEQGNSGNVLGHPLNSVAFVANHLQERGKQLRAGEFVMTGSALKTRFPVPGDHAVYHVDGLGEVVASVANAV